MTVRLRRPAARWNGQRKFAACPACQADISDSLGVPLIPTMRLADQYPSRVEGDTINVRGYECDDCKYVLAIAPQDSILDVHDPWGDEPGSEITDPWRPVSAHFADGSKRGIIVPTREVQQ